MCKSQQIEQAVKEYRAGKDRDDNFRLIYECYREMVFRFFFKRGFNRDLCHDLTQIVFLRVYTGMTKFRGVAEFGAWLFQIAANVGIDDLRSGMTQKRAGDHISLDNGGDEAGALPLDLPDRSPGFQPLEAALDEERRQLLHDALMKLPEQMRRCMIFRVYHELSYQEIAIAMGLSVETVKAHLHKARAKLKAGLSSYFGKSGV